MLQSFSGGSPGASLGYSVGEIGDVDLDGLPDYATGAPYDDPFGKSNVGSALVFSGAPFSCAGAKLVYGKGKKGALSKPPFLSSPNCPRIGNSITLNVVNGVPGASGTILIGLTQASIPALGGTLLLNPIGEITHSLGLAGTQPGLASIFWRFRTLPPSSAPSYFSKPCTWRTVPSR